MKLNRGSHTQNMERTTRTLLACRIPGTLWTLQMSGLTAALRMTQGAGHRRTNRNTEQSICSFLLNMNAYGSMPQTEMNRVFPRKRINWEELRWSNEGAGSPPNSSTCLPECQSQISAALSTQTPSSFKSPHKET